MIDFIKDIRNIEITREKYKEIIELYSNFKKIDTKILTIEKLNNIINSLHYNKNHFIYFYISKNKIIGAITLFIEQKIIHDGMCVGHIEDLVVNKTYRKMGVGKSLLNHVIDKSKSNSCYKCILNCDAALEKYYLNNGFIKKGLYMAKYF